MLWLTILVFGALLLALVLIHELGHLLAAKKAGCNVEEFGFGFPPRLFSVMYKGTRYSFNLFPLGGFVRIEGEDMSNENPGPGNFAAKSAGWRIFILSAGVIMNVVLAVFLLSWQAGIGFPTLATSDNVDSLVDRKTYITNVAAGSPAESAGIAALDRVSRAGEIADPTVDQLQAHVLENAGGEVLLELESQGQRRVVTLTPRENPPAGEGALGVELAETGLTKVPWWQAPWAGVTRTFDLLAAIAGQFAIILGRLFSSGTVTDSLTGPVGIAVYANEVTKLGLPYILEFGALISLNLAIINILPFPALDGGRILFVILEKLRGRRIAGKIEQITHTVGFALLILLMVAITWRDIQKFF